MSSNPYAAPSVDPAPAIAEQKPGAFGPRTWTIGEVCSQGWSAVSRAGSPLLIGFALVSLINSTIYLALNQVMLGGVDPAAHPEAALKSLYSSLPVLLLVSFYFLVGQARAALAAVRGNSVSLGSFFSGYDRLISSVIVGVIFYIGLAVGLMLLLVPGMILVCAWSLVYFLLADTQLSATEVFSESWALTRGHRLRLFGLLAILGLGSVIVSWLPELALGALPFQLKQLASSLVTGLVMPFLFLPLAVAYEAMTGRSAPEAS